MGALLGDGTMPIRTEIPHGGGDGGAAGNSLNPAISTIENPFTNFWPALSIYLSNY